MDVLLDHLNKKGVLLFYGSMGTQLMLRGLNQGEIPDIWNIKKPNVVQEIFKNYFAAGSDLVQTATFRANPIALKSKNYENLIEKINKSSASLLKGICPEGKLIVGDIGPSGIFFPPVGEANFDELVSSFKQQAKVLAPYIDAFHLETFSDIQEMKAAIEGVKKITNKPIIASMTYNKKSRGFFTIMGDTLKNNITELTEAKISVIGANCTLGSTDFIELFKDMRTINDTLPMSVKPNAGQPILQNGKLVYKQSPEEFSKDMNAILNLNNGLLIIGGCCGTSPDHIKLLRQIINQRISG